MGFANQPSIGPEDVSAIVALSVPTILLLGSAWLVGLPHVQRYVDDCDRVNALEPNGPSVPRPRRPSRSAPSRSHQVTKHRKADRARAQHGVVEGAAPGAGGSPGVRVAAGRGLRGRRGRATRR